MVDGGWGGERWKGGLDKVWGREFWRFGGEKKGGGVCGLKRFFECDITDGINFFVAVFWIESCCFIILYS